mgnify:CR=1 FL=1
MVEENKKPKRRSPSAPKPIKTKEPVVGTFDPSPLLARIDKLENGAKLTTDAVEFVKSTNWFILAVLFLGFVTILVSFISLIIQATNSSTATQIEFIKTIDELKYKIVNEATQSAQ